MHTYAGAVFRFKRRDRLVIIVDILKAARYGIRKTGIMQNVNLSYDQLGRYLDVLISYGLMRKDGDIYKPTEKGLKLIEDFESIRASYSNEARVMRASPPFFLVLKVS